MKRFMVVLASTKRSPGIVGGKRGTPVTHLLAVRCTPLDPADGQAARDLAFRVHDSTNAPYRMRETFTDSGLDIVEGDTLVVGTRDYPIRHVDVWQWRGDQTFLKLLLEDEA